MSLKGFDLEKLNFVTKIFNPTINEKQDIIIVSTNAQNSQPITLTVNDISIRNTNMNFDVVKKNFDKTLESLKIIKNDVLVQQFMDICVQISNCNSLSFKELDDFVHIDCTINGKLTTQSFGDQFNEIKQLISNSKNDYLNKIKQYLDQSTIIEQFILTEKLADNVLEHMVKLTFPDKSLNVIKDMILLNSPNVVWSGGLVYDIIYNLNLDEINYHTDIDLFVIGTDHEKQNIINQIVKNVASVFGESNILFQNYNSIINILIKGYMISIQLIMFGDETTSRLDVIKHFDFTYLHSIISFNDEKNEFVLTTTSAAKESIKLKILCENSKHNQKLKLSRIIKAFNRGFDVNNLLQQKIIINYNKIKQQYYINKLYSQTNKLLNNTNSIKQFMSFEKFTHMFESNPLSVVLKGNFINSFDSFDQYINADLNQPTQLLSDTYKIANNQLTTPIIKYKMQTYKGIFISAFVNILDIYGSKLYPFQGMYVQIKDKDIINKILDYYEKLFDKFASEKNTKNMKESPSIYILRNQRFTSENFIITNIKENYYPEDSSTSNSDSENSDSETETKINKFNPLKYIGKEGMILKIQSNNISPFVQQHTTTLLTLCFTGYKCSASGMYGMSVKIM